MNRIKFLAIACFATFLFSCGDDEMPNTCETSDLTYTNSIAAIFNSSCAVSGCHVTGGPIFSMENYQDLFTAVGNGRIIGAINQEANFEPMPRNSSKLDQCTIDKITAWINNGAPE